MNLFSYAKRSHYALQSFFSALDKSRDPKVNLSSVLLQVPKYFVPIQISRASPKTFIPAQKLILLNANHLFVHSHTNTLLTTFHEHAMNISSRLFIPLSVAVLLMGLTSIYTSK